MMSSTTYDEVHREQWSSHVFHLIIDQNVNLFELNFVVNQFVRVHFGTIDHLSMNDQVQWNSLSNDHAYRKS